MTRAGVRDGAAVRPASGRRMSRHVKPSIAAEILNLNPRTLHKWAREGRITRYADGFDLGELLIAEASRDHSALLARAGIAHKDWPETVRPSR